jgi:hypothetical protein
VNTWFLLLLLMRPGEVPSAQAVRAHDRAECEAAAAQQNRVPYTAAICITRDALAVLGSRAD